MHRHQIFIFIKDKNLKSMILDLLYVSKTSGNYFILYDLNHFLFKSLIVIKAQFQFASNSLKKFCVSVCSALESFVIGFVFYMYLHLLLFEIFSYL